MARARLATAVLAALLAAAAGTPNLPQGSACSADGVNGTCVLWYHCLSLVADHFQREPYPPVCSFVEQEPVVCCTSCGLAFDIRNIVVDTVFGGLLYETTQKSWNKCIDYYLNLPYRCRAGFQGGVRKSLDETKKCHKIMDYGYAAAGGNDAERGEFPHMALLGYGESEETAQWACGGTVISERYILTAGHCLTAPRLGGVRYAALGILRRSDPARLWQRYRVAAAIPHPEYDPPAKYHDIALLKTDREIEFSMDVLPACLPKISINIDDFSGYKMNTSRVQAAGWGSTGPGAQVADTLQRVTLTRFRSKVCRQQYSKHRQLRRGYNRTTQMCYGDQREVKDTCEGDSGGPLQVPGQLAECQPTVVGVTSFGQQCGFVGSAGVYTRVAHYVPWIDSVVWP